MEFGPCHFDQTMGNNRMFQLEDQLQNWTRNLNSLESMQRHDVEELEQHLRDSIAMLKSDSLSEEEAFLIATHRVGKPDELEREFGKINVGYLWTRRLIWMLSGFLFFEISGRFFEALSSIGQAFAAIMGGGAATWAYVPIGITWFCWFSFAFLLWRRKGAESAGNTVVQFFSKTRGTVITLVATLLVVMITAVDLFSKVVANNMTSGMQERSEYFFTMALSISLIEFLLPIVFLIVLLKLRPSLPNVQAAEQ